MCLRGSFDIMGILAKLFGIENRSEHVTPIILSDCEKDVVLRFAAGDKKLRDRAIVAYREGLRRLYENDFRGDVRSVCPEMAFMSEIDHPCPCHILKEKYRKELLGHAVREA
jgi:hypothetical protein